MRCCGVVEVVEKERDERRNWVKSVERRRNMRLHDCVRRGRLRLLELLWDVGWDRQKAGRGGGGGEGS